MPEKLLITEINFEFLMKKKLISSLFAIGIALSSTANAVIDTTTVLYDFNALTVGNLNGQDGWITTKHNTSGDYQVGAGAGYDTSKALTFALSGPSVGIDASRSFASLFSNTVFSSTSSTYIIQFDVLRSYWGVQFVIGADINNDGKIANSDVNEKAIIYSTSTQGGDKLTLPNGIVTTYAASPTVIWKTFEITLSNFNSSNSGNITVKSKDLGSSTWNTIASNLALGIDTNSSTKTNPALWKMIFLHNEGAGGKIDNISITRIGPQVITRVPQLNTAAAYEVFPNPVTDRITIQSKYPTENTFFTLLDFSGRTVLTEKLNQTTQHILLSNLPKGIYLYTLSNEHGTLKSEKIINP